MSRIPTRRSAGRWLSYRRYRARLGWAVWRGWLDTVPVGFFDGPPTVLTAPTDFRELPALSLEDVDELFQIVGDYQDLVEWLVGPLAYAVEYDCLPRLREMRAALAAIGGDQ